MLCRTLGHCAQRESMSDIIQRNSVGNLNLTKKMCDPKKSTKPQLLFLNQICSSLFQAYGENSFFYSLLSFVSQVSPQEKFAQAALCSKTNFG